MTIPFWIENLPALLRGLVVSIELFAVSTAAGLLLGFLLSLLAVARHRVVRVIALVITEIGRGIPSLVMLQLVYFGLPSAGIRLNAMPAAWIALSATTAAYAAEILRGGYAAVPAGQLDAARGLALTPRQTLRHIMVPQGIRLAMAPLSGFCLQMFQATSLAYALSIPELLSRAYDIGSVSFRYLEILSLAGILYAFVGMPWLLTTSRLESRIARNLGIRGARASGR